MKKLLFLIIIIFLIIFIILYAKLLEANEQKKTLNKYNINFEIYANKTAKGIEVATLINKAIDINEKNKIKKDDKGFYIENEDNSIKIEILLYGVDTPYQMETLHKVGISSFIENFNTINFKCTKIDYHNNTGKVKKIYFVEEYLEETYENKV